MGSVDYFRRNPVSAKTAGIPIDVDQFVAEVNLVRTSRSDPVDPAMQQR
jgi:hypothetical protein